MWLLWLQFTFVIMWLVWLQLTFVTLWLRRYYLKNQLDLFEEMETSAKITIVRKIFTDYFQTQLDPQTTSNSKNILHLTSSTKQAHIQRTF